MSEASSSTSPVTGTVHARGFRFQCLLDRVEWPLQHFPSPSSDGRWSPASGPPPPSKFPPLIPDVPSDLTLDPPVMAFTYPPPPPFTLGDPIWAEGMMNDMMRQRSHLINHLLECEADAARALAEATLADLDLDEELAKRDHFLDTVKRFSGKEFLDGMLQDAEEYCEIVMSRLQSNDEENETGSSPSPRSANDRSSEA